MPTYYGNSTYQRGRGRTRGRSYGRARDRHGSRGSDYRSRSSHSAQRRNQDDLYSAISSLAKAVKEIQDRLDNREDTANRNPIKSRLGSKTADLEYTNKQYFDKGSGQSKPRSENPDFRDLVRDTSMFVRLDYHMQNWAQCPTSIQHAVDNLIENIRPPVPSLNVQQRLQQAGEDFKTAICTAVKAHLHHQSHVKLQNIVSYNDMDKHLVDSTVYKIIKRHHGSKISDRFIDESLDKIDAGAKRLKMGADTRTQGASGSGPPVNNKRSHESDVGSNLGDVEASPPDKRIAIHTISPHDDALPQRATEDSVQEIEEPQNIVEDDTIDNLAQLDAEVNNSKGVTYTKKRPFIIPDLPYSINTIFIMDSNGNSFNSLQIPPNTRIFAFAGAKIGDIPKILSASQSHLQDIDHIICNVGVNDRENLHVPDIIKHLENIAQWCSTRKQKLTWLGIPEYANLPQEATYNINTINKIASDILADDFLPSIRSLEIQIVAGDKHKIHYTEKTARAILDLFGESLN